MKKTFQISKQQITYLHEISGDSTKLSLEEMFPEAFEQELITGVWYKSKDKSKKWLTFFKDINDSIIDDSQYIGTSYGFDYKGNWYNEDTEEFINDGFVIATEEEVFERLKEEAVKRGFKKGVTVDRYKLQLHPVNTGNIVKTESDCFSYGKGYFKIDGYSIFSDGEWAEICITKEEAEKELGKKII